LDVYILRFAFTFVLCNKIFAYLLTYVHARSRAFCVESRRAQREREREREQKDCVIKVCVLNDWFVFVLLCAATRRAMPRHRTRPTPRRLELNPSMLLGLVPTYSSAL